MPNTTNYSFPTPADTDLVKNGADAIRDLGDAVDTAMNTALGTKKAMGVLLSTVSFSAVSSFSFPDNSFTSTYDNYRMLIITDASASPGTLLWRGRVAGVDTSTGNYDRQSSSVSNTTYAGARTSGQTSGLLGDIFSAGQNSISMDIFSPKLTKTTLVRSLNLNSDFGVRLIDCGSYYALTTSFDSISVIVSTGTITGKASLYGYNL